MPKKIGKNKTGKKRGGQPVHKGDSRLLYEVSECSSVLEHHPKTCSCCREILLGEDANPHRHKIVEIPPVNPIIVEHRLHQMVCKQCGTLARAKLTLFCHFPYIKKCNLTRQEFSLKQWLYTSYEKIKPQT